LAASGFMITLFVALAQEVLFILVPPPYYAAFKAIPLLATGFLFFTSAHISVVAIMVKNKTVYIMLACWLVAALNLGLNALLIPRLGLVGAGAATGFSYIIFALAYALISRRLWKVDYPQKTLTLLLIIPLVAIAVITLIAYGGPGLVINFFFKLLIAAAAGFFLLLVVMRGEGMSFKELGSWLYSNIRRS